jgi:hypothetical protein
MARTDIGLPDSELRIGKNVEKSHCGLVEKHSPAFFLAGMTFGLYSNVGFVSQL